MQPLVRRSHNAVRAGFSLAELMVVIVIIGLLGTVVVPQLMARFGTAQKTVAKADINAIYDAIVQYQLNNAQRWPNSLDDLVTPDENGVTFLNRTTVPKDPWGNEYIYNPPRSGEQWPEIMSYGKDGSPGGEGDDRDITYAAIKNQEI